MQSAAPEERGQSAARAATVQLSADELDILRLLARGRPLEICGRELGVSERTIRRRIRALCDRLNVTTPVECVVVAVRAGLI